ncbi:MAG: hypothetical protein UMV23_05690 [Halanaerobium sp.]|nr:hypothetical protein [Halanaerobium sp.]
MKDNFPRIERALEIVVDEFASAGLLWGVGGSLLLYFHGLLREPNDIDILISEENAKEGQHILHTLGKRQETAPTILFCTRYFSTYKIAGVKVDLMGGFAIKHQAGVYHINFTPESRAGYYQLASKPIPCCRLEDWFVIYQLIPGKRDKARLIAEYFKLRGLANPSALHKALQRPLPPGVALEVEELLNSINS